MDEPGMTLPEDPQWVDLQRRYGGIYRVWRTPGWWMATAQVEGITPTLMERTPEELEEHMRRPGRQIGGPVVRQFAKRDTGPTQTP